MRELSEAAERTIARVLIYQHRESVREVAEYAELARKAPSHFSMDVEHQARLDKRLKEIVAAIKEFGEITPCWLKKWMEEEIALNEKQATQTNQTN